MPVFDISSEEDEVVTQKITIAELQQIRSNDLQVYYYYFPQLHFSNSCNKISNVIIIDNFTEKFLRSNNYQEVR